MSVELKIKSKHLALEPAIIRIEEKKLCKQFEWFKKHHQIGDVSFWEIYKNHPELYKLHTKRCSLEQHRKTDVRNEARATYLARAFISGKRYKDVERICKDEDHLDAKIIPRIVSMVAKYGKPEDRIHKYYNSKTGRTEYKPEDYARLVGKVDNWLVQE